MALVFAENALGTSVGIPISGVVPITKLEMGVQNANDFIDVAALGARVGQAGDNLVRRGSNYAYGLGRAVKDGIATRFNLDDPEGAAKLQTSGWQDVPQEINYAYGAAAAVGGWEAVFGERSLIPLTKIIKPLGLVTGIALDFQEPVNKLGVRVEGGATAQLYQGTISGIAFDGTCDAPCSQMKDKDGNLLETVKSDASCTEGNRTGVEPILEYFYHHRVTNIKKELTQTIMYIGITMMRGWVVGMTIEPANVDYRIWRWSINLLISPDYVPRPPMDRADLSARNPKAAQVYQPSELLT